MKFKARWILILVLLTGLTLVACGGGGNEEPASTNNEVATVDESPADTEDTEPEATATTEPEPTVEPEPTEEPDPTATAEPDPPAEAEPTARVKPTAAPDPTKETASGDDESEASEKDKTPLDEVLQDLQLGEEGAAERVTSFAFELRFAFSNLEDPDALMQEVNMSFAYSLEPPMASLVLTAQGLEEEMGEFNEISMVQIDDTVYLSFPGMGCISDNSGEMDLLAGEDPFQESFSPESLLEELDISEVSRVMPDETINGIEVEHYTFDETFLEGEDAEEIEQAEGHIYIAKEDGYLVRMQVEAEGDLEGFGDEGEAANGILNFGYNLTSYNEPVEITVPEACGETAEDIALPILEDAYEVSSFGTITSYKSDVALDEAITFYEDAMVEAGYVKDDEGSFLSGSFATLVYVQDGETVSVIISEEDAGNLEITLLTESG